MMPMAVLKVPSCLREFKGSSGFAIDHLVNTMKLETNLIYCRDSRTLLDKNVAFSKVGD